MLFLLSITLIYHQYDDHTNDYNSYTRVYKKYNILLYRVYNMDIPLYQLVQ